MVDPAGKLHLTRYIRGSLAVHLYDESGGGEGRAIYTLSDPRDLRQVRYVGQTLSPARRYLQHVGMARLWMPDAVPWWIKQPRSVPLYEWIRSLHQEGRRLPVMVVCSWTTPSLARLAERERIVECLAAGMPLLNVEPRLTGRQRLIS